MIPCRVFSPLVLAIILVVRTEIPDGVGGAGRAGKKYRQLQQR